jgi:hypothetical protein
MGAHHVPWRYWHQPHVPAATCSCGRHTQGSEINHANSFNRLSGSRSGWHNHWKEALGRISARGDLNARIEPTYTSIGVAAAGRQGARANIELTLTPPRGTTLMNISMIHPCCPTHVVAVFQLQGTAAAVRDRSKYQAYVGHCAHVTPSFLTALTRTGTSVRHHA